MKDVFGKIKQYETAGDFTYASVSDEMLEQSEQILKITIPEEYRQFLKEFGHGGIGGIEILGVGKNCKKIFEQETLKYRSYGMPEELIVIENCDEWVYCINTMDGAIVKWLKGCAEYAMAFSSFDEYLLSRLNDIIENM